MPSARAMSLEERCCATSRKHACSLGVRTAPRSSRVAADRMDALISHVGLAALPSRAFKEIGPHKPRTPPLRSAPFPPSAASAYPYPQDFIMHPLATDLMRTW